MFKVTASSARQQCLIYYHLLPFITLIPEAAAALLELNERTNSSFTPLVPAHAIIQMFDLSCNTEDSNLNKKGKQIIDCIITTALQPFLKKICNTALDITVVNTVHQALVEEAPKEDVSAVKHTNKTKLRKYEERCNTFGHLAIDTFSGWHKVG